MNAMRSIVVGLVCLAAAVAQAGENLVANGDFEAKGFSDSHKENCGSSYLIGWTCSQAGICTPQGTYLDKVIQDYDNTAWAFLKKASWFAQDINIPAPGRYRLEFDYCGRKAMVSGAKTFISLGDVDIATVNGDGGSADGTKVVHMAYEFYVFADGTQTLKFEQKVTADVSPAFDNIRLELVYVFANLLKVTGEPLGTIPSTPPYGINTNQAASVVCSLSAEATDIGPESRTNSVFSSWTLYTLDPYNSLARASEDGSGATQPVTVNLNGGAKELVWHFPSSYKVTGRPVTEGAGSVTVSGDWFADGADCTVTATENVLRIYNAAYSNFNANTSLKVFNQGRVSFGGSRFGWKVANRLQVNGESTLEFVFDGQQVMGDIEYRIVRDPTLVCVVEANRRGTGWRRIFSFDTAPQLPLDFAYAHYWCETHPSSTFRRRYWVYLPQADGSVRTLSLEPDPETGEPAHVLAHIMPDGKIGRTWLRGDAAFAAALEEHFGIREG